MPIARTTAQTKFGPFLEGLRQKRRLTLREFCRRAGCDPANLSRIERGLMPPPRSEEIIEKYAAVLGLQRGSDEWHQLFDLAAAEHGRVPADLMSDKELVAALPTFFRTLRGQKPTIEEMRRLADKIRRGGK